MNLLQKALSPKKKLNQNWPINNPFRGSLSKKFPPFYKSNMMGATDGAGTTYLSGAPEFTPGF